MRDTLVTPFTFREAMRGHVALETLPFEVARQIEAMRRRMYRQQQRSIFRETKAREYAANGLNGKRVVARRLRQINLWYGAAGASLTPANGLVPL